MKEIIHKKSLEIQAKIERLGRRLLKSQTDRNEKQRRLDRLIIGPLHHHPNSAALSKKKFELAKRIEEHNVFELELKSAITILNRELEIARTYENNILATISTTGKNKAQRIISSRSRPRDKQIELDTEEDLSMYDVFISHASEDKEDVVRPLVQDLKDLGLRVWFDEFELKLGDSLRRSIDAGLKSSRFGVVVLSKAFFAKQWPQYELDSLVAREIEEGKVILPIWHGVDKAEVMHFSLKLADKVAASTSVMSHEDLALQVYRALI